MILKALWVLVALRPFGGISPDTLVDVGKWVPAIRQDIRYATPNNFTRKVVYPKATCLLRYAIAQRLARVQHSLEARGLGLKVWDCYRPFSVQEAFFKLVPEEKYVARPVRENGQMKSGSKHNRGAAVDLTLVDKHGIELSMPTDHDDFSEKAASDWDGATPEQKRNRAILRREMEKQGFAPLPSEWWHFDGPGWEKYPLADEPL